MIHRKVKLMLRRLHAISLFRWPAVALRTMHRVLARKTHQLRQPLPDALMLEVTNHCQLHCSTCAREYRLGQEMDRGHMDLHQAKEFLNTYLEKLNRIALTGLGEPLLYPHLKELVTFIHQKDPGVLLFLSTNAQHPHTVEIIKSIAHAVDTLQISMDGYGQTYEGIRIDGNFTRFLTTLTELGELARQTSMEIKMNMVVFEENYTDMSAVIRCAAECNIPEVHLNTMNRVAHDDHRKGYEFYSTKPFLTALQQARSTAAERGITLVSPALNEPRGFSACPYPWSNYAISWDGWLVPCCSKPFPRELNFGNVFEEPLEKCINHPALQDFRRRVRENTPAPSFCSGCHYLR
ncbi:MAG: SPASM domain-containing protein [Fibrobacterota bacterium]